VGSQQQWEQQQQQQQQQAVLYISQLLAVCPDAALFDKGVGSKLLYYCDSSCTTNCLTKGLIRSCCTTATALAPQHHKGCAFQDQRVAVVVVQFLAGSLSCQLP
jgi:hypothetical protein